MTPPQTVTITMVSALKPCKKCEACELMIKRLQEQFPGQIEYRKIRADDPEAEQFGVVMPPMMIVDDFLVSAGNVPIESGLKHIIEEQLGV